MADPRFYAKLDVGYFDNPKTADLVETHPRALIFHLRAILYCRQHLTNGRFPVRLVARLACATYCGGQCQGQCDVCASRIAGLVREVDERTYEVHDYLEHQDSAEDIAKRKTAGQRAAAARWGGDGNAEGSAKGNAPANAEGNAEGNAKERRGEDIKSTRANARADAHAELPEQFLIFWDLYPKKRSRGAALKAWTQAVRKEDPSVIIDGLRSQLPWFASQVRADGDYRPSAGPWLNGERWTDETEAPQATRDDDNPWAHLPTDQDLVDRRGF